MQSFPDAYLTEVNNPNTIHILVSEGGLVVYGRPRKDPGRRKLSLKREFRDIALEWGEENGLDFLASEKKMGYAAWVI